MPRMISNVNNFCGQTKQSTPHWDTGLNEQAMADMFLKRHKKWVCLQRRHQRRKHKYHWPTHSSVLVHQIYEWFDLWADELNHFVITATPPSIAQTGIRREMQSKVFRVSLPYITAFIIQATLENGKSEIGFENTDFVRRSCQHPGSP